MRAAKWHRDAPRPTKSSTGCHHLTLVTQHPTAPGGAVWGWCQVVLHILQQLQESLLREGHHHHHWGGKDRAHCSSGQQLVAASELPESTLGLVEAARDLRRA